MPRARLAKIVADLKARTKQRDWAIVNVAAWAAIAGIDTGLEVDGEIEGPHAAMIERDWQRAADEFAAIGWPYERALCLSLLDDEAALAESIAIARQLGAVP